MRKTPCYNEFAICIKIGSAIDIDNQKYTIVINPFHLTSHLLTQTHILPYWSNVSKPAQNASFEHLESIDNQHPFGGCFASSSTGKERDEETGYCYFGARYYDSDLSGLFLSVDPMADKYPSISPYAYCNWNPVKLVDPDGNEAWKPDPDGNLIAEKGDNATTLAKFCNTTVENAQKMLSEQGLPSNGEVAEGSKLTMDNVFTRSIQAAKEGKIACLTDEQFDEQTMGMNNDQFKQWWNNWCSDVSDKYNCWGSAITGSQGNEIVGGCGIDTPEEYSQRLSDGYSPVNPSDAVFGKTVISFSRGGTIQHGAVYYGTDNNGVVYVYTKNGWFAPPTVSPLSTVKSEYKSRVSGYHNPNE